MASIKKRGNIYYVTYYFAGKKRWRRAGPREADARRLKAKIEKAIYEGTYQEKENITFSELADKWLATKEGAVRPKTMATYKAHVNRLKGHFGDIRVRSIGPEEAERFAASLMKAELKPATVARSLAILKAIMEAGVRWGYMAANPAAHIKRPRIPKAEVDYLEPEEVRRLLRAAAELDKRWSNTGHNRRYLTCRKTLLMFAILTGCRQSEILGLRWGDVDLEERKVYIRQVLQGGKFYPPKSEAGRRVIDIPPILAEELKAHRLRQAVELPGNPHDLVFTSEAGTPLCSRNVTQRILEPALRFAGLRKVGFHALRHTYVSMLIAQGENVKTIQALVGHASAAMTWDVYGHLFENAGREAARRLQDALFGEMVKFDATEFATET
ncbi:MAG: tyrosine-type recombinase/integrase [Actinomycetota bacterium]